ncbi:hypothetical protein INT44_001885 [Umbelopsis vinacea]|uniref:NOT2/NOT3/NOT5 C-terminal domain-containing protein n=1 Tax=Umbelopsis vinacea TaxID=44442 RepID=A0A8H7UEK2_9FUNG|nr:hypothetical protein INT44_001885 [Umbelopsis vinacea]
MLALTHMLSSASLSSSPSSNNSPPSTAFQDFTVLGSRGGPLVTTSRPASRYTPNAIRDGFDSGRRKSSPGYGLARANQLMSSLGLPSPGSTPKFANKNALDMKLPMYGKPEGIDIVQWLSTTNLSDAQNESILLHDMNALDRLNPGFADQDMYSAEVRSASSNMFSGNEDAAGPYGLRGLLAITADDSPSDLLVMTVGCDPSSLGLDLDSTSLLSEQFYSPWADFAHNPTPDLPAHYKTLPVPSPNLIVQQMSTFSNESLFYMFYSLPGDMMQNAAAMELYQRNWRYHTELFAWLTLKSGLAPPDTSSDYVPCIIFDPSTWTYVSQNLIIGSNALEQIY